MSVSHAGPGRWLVPQPAGSAPRNASGGLAMPQLFWHRTLAQRDVRHVVAAQVPDAERVATTV